MNLLGPGLHWNRTREELVRAIERAEQDGQADAAGHLRIILESRDRVVFAESEPWFEKEAPDGSDAAPGL